MNELVSREMVENLRFRREVLHRASFDVAFRSRLMGACSEEMLLWVNLFVWTCDPRKSATSRAAGNPPFISWGYQDETFAELERVLRDGEDLLIEKSRDMGASWMCMVWMLWRWFFRPGQKFLVVSRKAELVDGDEDSLFAHVDYVLDRIPPWMMPVGWNTKQTPQVQSCRSRMKLKNPENGSVIEGEATTKNLGRGGRRTAVMIDEFAAFESGGYEVLMATADTTRTRIFNSTPQGPTNAFYSQRQKGTARVRLHWSRHPEKSLGLYRPLGRGSNVEILDKEWHERNPGYKFRGEVPAGEEGLRSPWYDKECDRRAGPVEIARELDIDYQGSASPFFDAVMLEEHRRVFCREPQYEGNLRFEQDGPNKVWTFEEQEGGYLRIWCPLRERIVDFEREPVLEPADDHPWGVACDISQGTGMSNSVAVVADLFTGEKVAEMVWNRWGIEEFADLVVGLCGWFSHNGTGAHLIWEATGPGQTFAKHVLEQNRYTNIYFYSDETFLGGKQSQRPGWWQNGDNKYTLLVDYQAALRTRRFLNPSAQALQEASLYVCEGKMVKFKGMVDGMLDEKGHGDRVIADALAAKICKTKGIKIPEKREPVKAGSFLWRRQLRREKAASEKDIW